jgi:hypothetical protein
MKIVLLLASTMLVLKCCSQRVFDTHVPIKLFRSALVEFHPTWRIRARYELLDPPST